MRIRGQCGSLHEFINVARGVTDGTLFPLSPCAPLFHGFPVFSIEPVKNVSGNGGSHHIGLQNRTQLHQLQHTHQRTSVMIRQYHGKKCNMLKKKKNAPN